MFQTPVIIKKGNKFETGPTMRIASVKEGKTQVEWVATVG
jgi:hypothetical protein